MTCRELIDFLMSYLDGELPSDERRLFEEHLDICEACRAYLHDYRETVKISKLTLTDEEATSQGVPEELVQAILAARRAVR